MIHAERRTNSSPSRGQPDVLSSVDRSINTNGFAFRERRVAARNENPPHEHEYQCVGFILEGFGTADFARESWVVGPGNINVIPAGIRHHEGFGSPVVRWCSLELRDPPTEVGGLVRRAFARPVQFASGPACEIARRIASELRISDDVTPLALWGLGTELLAAIARSSTADGERPGSRWLRKVEEQLRECCTAPLSVSEIAADAGVHPGHLARMFRRVWGCSIGEFVRAERVERAKVLLASNDLPIAHIAQRVGFSDQAHFTRVFKRLTGTTPAAYRTSFRPR